MEGWKGEIESAACVILSVPIGETCRERYPTVSSRRRRAAGLIIIVILILILIRLGCVS